MATKIKTPASWDSLTIKEQNILKKEIKNLYWKKESTNFGPLYVVLKRKMKDTFLNQMVDVSFPYLSYNGKTAEWFTIHQATFYAKKYNVQLDY